MNKWLHQYKKNVFIAIIGALLLILLQILGLGTTMIMIGYYIGMYLSFFLFPILGYEGSVGIVIYIAIPIFFLLYAITFSYLFNKKLLFYSTIIILVLSVPSFFYIDSLNAISTHKKIAQNNAAVIQLLSEQIIHNPDATYPLQNSTILLKLKIKNILTSSTKGKMMFYVGTSNLGEVVCSEVDSPSNSELLPGESTELDLSCMTSVKKLEGTILPLHVTYSDSYNNSHDYISKIVLK